jgi:hypothetical protein
VLNYISKGGEPNEILLLFYWTLSLPALGQALAGQARQYPMQRNRLLRLLEPMGAPEEEEAWQPGVNRRPARRRRTLPGRPGGHPHGERPLAGRRSYYSG